MGVSARHSRYRLDGQAACNLGQLGCCLGPGVVGDGAGGRVVRWIISAFSQGGAVVPGGRLIWCMCWFTELAAPLRSRILGVFGCQASVLA
jgi:hypothetical protein